jgi:hypothetical protein
VFNFYKSDLLLNTHGKLKTGKNKLTFLSDSLVKFFPTELENYWACPSLLCPPYGK